MKKLLLAIAVCAAQGAMADSDYLVKVTDSLKAKLVSVQNALPSNSKVEDLGVANWIRIQSKTDLTKAVLALRQNPEVLRVEKNRILRMIGSPALTSKVLRERLLSRILADDNPMPMPGEPPADNPDIPTRGSGGSGADPDFSKQWGMNQIGAKAAWEKSAGNPEVVVAVIDTGVDYTHEDLVDNMWRNPNEIAGNNVDDDHNGYVDDIVGWDFASNDNKPYDLTVSIWDILMGGGNPGHGTHCAGNVAARGNNGKGIAGVAPNVRIMAIRFITEKGQGTTADAIKAVKYGADNGAKVLSNSWGSEGDDGDSEAQALKDAILYAQNKGVLFVAAAGNGHQGVGYDNDSDSKPAVPASYDMDSIVSVAAIDEAGNLGAFSNWGARSVDLAAPGVVVYSTVPGNLYQDTIIDFAGIKATWDGTSMATPHVAGAAALYWSLHPEKTYAEVKAALIASVKKTSVLANKMVSGGQLDVQSLMNQ